MDLINNSFYKSKEFNKFQFMKKNKKKYKKN